MQEIDKALLLKGYQLLCAPVVSRMHLGLRCELPGW
jgi:hypothetical protein